MSHFQANNFYNEGLRAGDLSEPRFDIPNEATWIYVGSMSRSFLGDLDGHGWGVDPLNRKMIFHATIERAEPVLSPFENVAIVQLALTPYSPVQGMKVLIEILFARPIPPTHENKSSFFTKTSVSQIEIYLLMKLVQEKDDDILS